MSRPEPSPVGDRGAAAPDKTGGPTAPLRRRSVRGQEKPRPRNEGTVPCHRGRAAKNSQLRRGSLGVVNDRTTKAPRNELSSPAPAEHPRGRAARSPAPTYTLFDADRRQAWTVVIGSPHPRPSDLPTSGHRLSPPAAIGFSPHGHAPRVGLLVYMVARVLYFVPGDRERLDCVPGGGSRRWSIRTSGSCWTRLPRPTSPTARSRRIRNVNEVLSGLADYDGRRARLYFKPLSGVRRTAAHLYGHDNPVDVGNTRGGGLVAGARAGAAVERTGGAHGLV